MPAVHSARPAAGPDQGADIRPMGHKLVKCRYDPYGGFGLGVDT